MSSKVNECEKLLNEGDILYTTSRGEVLEVSIIKVEKDSTFGHYIYYHNKKFIKSNYIYNRNIGVTYFKTEEEAERKLHRLDRIAEKRKILKEYEQKLNNELDITDHYFIK